MAAPDYAAIQAALKSTLDDSAEFQAQTDAGVPILTTEDLGSEWVTMERCPAVQVELAGSSITIRRLGGLGSASPSDETIDGVARCWAFSGHSPADARRQAMELVTRTRDALEATRRLGGVVCTTIVSAVTFRPLDLGDRGLFQVGTISFRLLLKS